MARRAPSTADRGSRPPPVLNGESLARLRSVYWGLIGEVDCHLGRILDRLAHRGDLDQTLVLFTSDHGEMLGDHWMLGKAGFFPQAFHVPLLIRHPKGIRNHRVGAFTEHVDLMPTILDALGLAIPRQCDGHSLADFLAGALPPIWRTATHWEHDFRDLEARTYESALGLPSDACSIATRFDGQAGYAHFAGLPTLAFMDDPHWLTDRSRDPSCAGEILAQAQGMLSWRMLAAERRLTGCALTAQGVIGGYDPT